MRRRRAQLSAGDLAGNPILVGTVALLVTLVAVFLAYNANRGLPFVPTYQISVDLPNAAGDGLHPLRNSKANGRIANELHTPHRRRRI